MTDTELDWLNGKRAEARRQEFEYGEIAKTWDISTYLKIIDDQAREIRRLRTDVERMKKAT